MLRFCCLLLAKSEDWERRTSKEVQWGSPVSGEFVSRAPACNSENISRCFSLCQLMWRGTREDTSSAELVIYRMEKKQLGKFRFFLASKGERPMCTASWLAPLWGIGHIHTAEHRTHGLSMILRHNNYVLVDFILQNA